MPMIDVGTRIVADDAQILIFKNTGECMWIDVLLGKHCVEADPTQWSRTPFIGQEYGRPIGSLHEPQPSGQAN